MIAEECCKGAEGPDRVFRFEFQGVLGTVVDVRIEADEEARARGMAAFVVDELQRLEAVFSAFDDASELRRWRRGDLERPGAELCDLLGDVLVWQERSGGVFNPLVGELSEFWDQAEQHDRIPDQADLAEAAVAITDARFEMADGVPIRTGDCSRLNLNAIAKGYIVDRVFEASVATFAVDTISLNVGGDIRHGGGRPFAVGIENPLRPYDNEPPLTVINLADAALATSGSSRRGFRVAGKWFSHVLDPRSGQPASGPASVTVVAPTATAADVAATVATVFEPAQAVEWLEAVDDAAGLVIDGDGTASVTPGWTDRFGPLSSE